MAANMQETTALTAIERPMPDGSPSIGMRFAAKYGIHPKLLLMTLRETAFKQDAGNEATDAQLMALLVVADQFRLNPFTREIFAFFDKRKGIIPVVSIDGWVRIINDHPHYDGVEFIYSDEMVTPEGTKKQAHTWVEAVIYRKDISRPIRVREYLDEVYQPPRGQNQVSGPWQTHPKRFQRHKALIQGARVALGFGGIYDEDEANRIIDATATVVTGRVNTDINGLTGDLQRLASERQQQADQQQVIEHVADPVLKQALEIGERIEAGAAAAEPEPEPEKSKTFNPYEDIPQQDRFPE